jgi:hypothetical protein
MQQSRGRRNLLSRSQPFANALTTGGEVRKERN